MKTINKILPLAIIASAATVVTPLVTSCSGVNSITWIDGLEEIDPTDLYQFEEDDVNTIEAANNVGQLVYNVEHSTDPDIEEYKDAFKKDLMFGRFYLGDQLLPAQYTDMEFNYYKYSIETLRQDVFFEVGIDQYINLYSYKGDMEMQFVYPQPSGMLGEDDNYIEITATAHVDVHCVPLTVYPDDDTDFNPFGLNAMGFFPVILDEDVEDLPTWMYFANDWYFSWSLDLAERPLDENKQPEGSAITRTGSIYFDVNHLISVEDPTDYDDVYPALPDNFFPYGQLTLAWPSYCLDNLNIYYE